MKPRISEERSLKLAIKALRGREATDGTNAATSSPTAAGRLQEDQADRAAKARARRRLKALIARATRPGVIYSEAVTKANLRRRRSDESDAGSGLILKEGAHLPRVHWTKGEGGMAHPQQDEWKMLQDAQAVEARAEEAARREAKRDASKAYATFLRSQEQECYEKQLKDARECVEERRCADRSFEEFVRSEQEERMHTRREAQQLRDARKAQVEEREKEQRRARKEEIEEGLREAEHIRELDIADALGREAGRRAERERNCLNKQENARLVELKATLRQAELLEERRMQREHVERMHREETRRKSEVQKLRDRQSEISASMSAIQDKFNPVVTVSPRAEAGEDVQQFIGEENRAGNRARRKQLLEEQVCSLREQRSRLRQGLLRERQEHIAEAEDMEKRDMEALRQERLAQQRRREDALRIRRILEEQMTDKAKLHTAKQSSGRMTQIEKTLNKKLLSDAAQTLGGNNAWMHQVR